MDALFYIYLASLGIGFLVIAVSFFGGHDTDGLDGVDGMDGIDGLGGLTDFGTLFVLASQFLLGFGIGGLIGRLTGNELWGLCLAIFAGFLCVFFLRKMSRGISGFCRKNEQEIQRAVIGDRAVAMLALEPGRTGKVRIVREDEPDMEYFAIPEERISEDEECVVTLVDGASVFVRKLV